VPTTSGLVPDTVRASVALQSPNAARSTVSFIVAGVYRFSLTVTDSEGHQAKANLTVWVPEILVRPSRSSAQSTCFIGSSCTLVYAWRWLPLFVAPSTVQRAGNSSSSSTPPQFALAQGTQSISLSGAGVTVTTTYAANTGPSVRSLHL
jgi:hypothetical protein